MITAVLLGLLAAAAVLNVFGVDLGAPAHKVVVAAQDIQPGTPIRADQLQVVAWGGGKLPVGALERIDQVAGRVLRATVYAGEPLLESKLAAVSAKGGLASIITPGNRAISVRVDEVIGVAGFALPGAFVDVLVSAKDANSAPFSRIVLERVRVLAAEQETTADPSKPKIVRAVTLELTPREVELLDLARSVGSLSLALRSEFDPARGQGHGAHLADLGEATTPVGSNPAAPAPVATAHPLQPAASAAPVAAGAAGRAASPCCAAGLGVEEIRGK